MCVCMEIIIIITIRIQIFKALNNCSVNNFRTQKYFTVHNLLCLVFVFFCCKNCVYRPTDWLELKFIFICVYCCPLLVHRNERIIKFRLHFSFVLDETSKNWTWMKDSENFIFLFKIEMLWAQARWWLKIILLILILNLNNLNINFRNVCTTDQQREIIENLYF